MRADASGGKGRVWLCDELKLVVIVISGQKLGLYGGVKAKVEVGEHDVAVGAEENVLGFEIAVDEAEGVEVLESEEDFRGEEAGGGEMETV